MDCIDVLVRVQDLVSGRLPPAEREGVEEHLRTCPSCAAAAVCRVHAGDERALWENLGRAVAGRVLVEHGAEIRRAKPVLRKAPIGSRGPGGLVRVLQFCAAGMLCTVAVVSAATVGRWDELLGLDRWQPPRAVEKALPAEPSQPTAARDGVTLMDEAAETLAAILPGANDPEVSNRISAKRLTTRIHEERTRQELPAWTASALSKLEVFLLRAEAAAADAEEWQELRAIMARENLIRTCRDVRAYLDLAG